MRFIVINEEGKEINKPDIESVWAIQQDGKLIAISPNGTWRHAKSGVYVVSLDTPDGKWKMTEPTPKQLAFRERIEYYFGKGPIHVKHGHISIVESADEIYIFDSVFHDVANAIRDALNMACGYEMEEGDLKS